MVFTTSIFLFYFLPLFLGIYFALPRRFRNAFLCFGSYVFYGWWNPWFVLLMFGTTAVDYVCGLFIAAPSASVRQRKLGVAASVVSNVGLLAYFKYSGMATETLNAVLGLAGRGPLVVQALALPIGISFYTFQSMSYAIDLYRGTAKPARSLLDFMTYVSLFPHLVAGPIVRYHVVSEQIRSRRETLEEIGRGVAYLMIGFGKKMILANPLGDITDLAFDSAAPPWQIALFCALTNVWQFYFDFSGYSDMAVGLGHILGFTFPQNFDNPFHAESVTEYWRRWHVSLSDWLRENVYIPLGGNKHGRIAQYRNLILTMLIGGLWHGANWKFVVWGGAHGVLMAAESATRRRTLFPEWFPRLGRRLVMLGVTILSSVLFRAPSLSASVRYMGSMFGLRGADGNAAIIGARVFDAYHLIVFAIATVIVMQPVRVRDVLEAGDASWFRKPLGAVALGGIFVVAVCEMWVQSVNPFLYFQF